MSTARRPTPASTGSVGAPARPPFAFTLRTPPGWQVLRGDAASLGDDLLALVARTPLWAALDGHRRGGLAFVLHGVGRISAATGALVTLLRLPSGIPLEPGEEPEISTISLTWLRTAPVRADLDIARLVLRGGDPVDTGLGVGLVVKRAETTVTGAEQLTFQLAAAVPRSIWIAVLTGTTTAAQHVRALEQAVLDLGMTLQVDRHPQAAPPAPDDSSTTAGPIST